MGQWDLAVMAMRKSVVWCLTGFVEGFSRNNVMKYYYCISVNIRVGDLKSDAAGITFGRLIPEDSFRNTYNYRYG